MDNFKDKIKWEDLSKTTQRLKIFGGWIVSRDIYRGHNWTSGASDSCSISLVFIPDPFHWWKI